MLVGAPSFMLAVSCIGMPRPDVIGLISLLFMMAVGLACRQKFPQMLLLVDSARLSQVDQLTLLGMKHKYLSLNAALTRAPVFVFGWLSLGAVTLWSGWQHVHFP
jgi:hypothetical protein